MTRSTQLPTGTPTPNPAVIWRETPDGMVLADPVSGKVRVLNEVGALVWKLLGDGLTADAIRERVLAQFDAPAQEVERDLGQFLGELTQRNLVAWSG